jgi:hypothetical protein
MPYSEDKPMKKQLALGGLAATAIMLVSGAAFSGAVNTMPSAEIVEFSPPTHELFASVSGVINVFLHEPGTVHLPAIFGPGSHPPDPCFGLGLTWDGVVFADTLTHTQNTVAFEALLGLMAGFQCKAEITSDVVTGSTPAPIVSMNPVLQ